MSSNEADELIESIVPVHIRELASDVVKGIFDNLLTYELELNIEQEDIEEEVAHILNKEMGSSRDSALTFADYQRLSRRTAIYPRMSRNPIYPTLGLSGETSETVTHILESILGLVRSSGDISEAIKKMQRDDGGFLTEDKKERVTKEMGDMLWYISALSWEIGVPLHEIAKDNIDKLHSRQERGKLKGSGDNR